MKFLNEFIFDEEADAKKFIEDMLNLYRYKGYLTYGDVCKAYYGDDVDYNHYSIYRNHGWICIYTLEVDSVTELYTIIKPDHIENKFIVKFPEIEKIRKGE